MRWATKACLFLACFTSPRPCLGFNLPFRKNEAAQEPLPPPPERGYKNLLQSVDWTIVATATVAFMAPLPASVARLHTVARVSLKACRAVSIGLAWLLRETEEADGDAVLQVSCYTRFSP
ncbi:unnamed protein product [Ectocarpus sp. 13 AM-2016]